MADGTVKEEYLEKFIIEAGKVKFSTPDGRRWQMRQPGPEEAVNGYSAYRITLEAVLNDTRLAQLAPTKEALLREAKVRANTAQALYLLPLLLEDEHGQPAFDVFSEASMTEFEEVASDQAILNVWLRVLWGSIRKAVEEAKKKSQPDLSDDCEPARIAENGFSTPIPGD